MEFFNEHHHHIIKDGQLWGTLEPCVFTHPRQWTDNERTFIETLLPLLGDHVKTFVTKEQTI
jgi:GAF domain-containing protein